MTIVQFVSQDLVVTAMLIFGIVGFTRGARRELITTVFILFAYLLTTWWFEGYIGAINRIYRLIRIALSGALTSDNPGQALERVRGLPPLISETDEATAVRLITFIAIVWVGYLLSRRARRVLTPVGIATLRRPPDLLARFAGAVAGAINGFLILYYILPRFVPGVQAVLVIPTLTTSLLQQRWLPVIVLVAIAVFIFVGWERARSKG